MLEKPLNQLVDIDDLVRKFGFVVDWSSGEIQAHKNFDMRYYDVLRQKFETLKRIREGIYTIGDFLGKEEHLQPVLCESYLNGVDLDEMVSGLMKLGIGRPWNMPDYAILPIIYAINMLGFNRREQIDSEKSYINITDFLLEHYKSITIESCQGHVRVVDKESYDDSSHDNDLHRSNEDAKKRIQSQDNKYVVEPELHGSSLIHITRTTEAETSEKSKLIFEIRQELTKETRLAFSDTARDIEITPAGWTALCEAYPRIVIKEEVEQAARPIIEEVRNAWSAIINAVNRVSLNRGRNELLIKPELADVIANYALNGRYNKLIERNQLP